MQTIRLRKAWAIIKEVGPLATVVLSILSAVTAFQANRLSQISLSNQLESKFTVLCNYDYDTSSDYSVLIEGKNDETYIHVPLKCSIANLGGKTVTINRMYAMFDQTGNIGRVNSAVHYIRLEDATGPEVKNIKMNDFFSTNISVAAGQQQDLRLTAIFAIDDVYREYFNCDSPVPAEGSVRCKLETLKSEQWEKLVGLDTIDGADNVFMTFYFQTIDGKSGSGRACLPYQNCYSAKTK